MAYIIDNIPQTIRESKQLLRKLAAEQEQIHKRGCAIVRKIFPEAQVKQWDDEVASYIDDVRYMDAPDKGLDHYFSPEQVANPQIFSVYWSKPQIEARQSENLAKVRSQLNRLWKYEQDGKQLFDPDRECTYADRVRRRAPGDKTIGIKLHVDGGSIERWTDEQGFHKVFRKLIAGDWQHYDPFDAAYRNQTREVTSPAVCSMFRTYQGWIALSPQGPQDGTLEIVPMSRALAWIYLRALQDDVADDDLCSALAGRSLRCFSEYHSLVMDAAISVPQMNRGDGIWWHPDVVHGVEEKHEGSHYSNVIYIGAAPFCDKNEAYLKRQLSCFKTGESSPDFAAENYELDFAGRSQLADLTKLGRLQMGVTS